jgi:cysteine desulfurase/selenocysteine lyase
VLTELEHHSTWCRGSCDTGEDADREFVAIDDDGRLNLIIRDAAYTAQLVAFAQVSNGLGTISPARQMIGDAHAVGALVLSGASGRPARPGRCVGARRRLPVFSGHKTLGPPGSGALWARQLLGRCRPFLAGGDMILEVHLRRTVFNRVPHFEAGTPDIGAAIGRAGQLNTCRRSA